MPPPTNASSSHPGTNNTPLPPSVEKAYWRKCIELKRRINEIEENNDAARLRKVRLDRAIMKMRLERAFLLEQLAKRMDANVDESEPSLSPPPTVRLLFASFLLSSGFDLFDFFSLLPFYFIFSC
ncbi:hypothetical protein BDY21DRAFT_346772 [Lineolata rhizophorae]|uniref:INO80 complex subunit F domain-containing protein n=1 Tax=Lineolata rhizophorae TaxID=578093 RepID=A0A6A6NXN8_9PEZI|nr:hypothetical protein BDY21DRAFT_346772 [Lineolata rhizophorae]